MCEMTDEACCSVCFVDFSDQEALVKEEGLGAVLKCGCPVVWKCALCLTILYPGGSPSPVFHPLPLALPPSHYVPMCVCATMTWTTWTMMPS